MIEQLPSLNRMVLLNELILVNDGSQDQSWAVLRQKALANSNILAINLLQNYGQHTAIYCGLQYSTGDYVITLDDDLQNPPAEIIHLINAAQAGHDLVFGCSHQKHITWYRTTGSIIFNLFTRLLLPRLSDLTISNFRIIRRDLADRICAQQARHPYLTGLSLTLSTNPANVWVAHHPRPVGKSNYNLIKLIRLLIHVVLFSLVGDFVMRLPGRASPHQLYHIESIVSTGHGQIHSI